MTGHSEVSGMAICLYGSIVGGGGGGGGLESGGRSAEGQSANAEFGARCGSMFRMSYSQPRPKPGRNAGSQAVSAAQYTRATGAPIAKCHVPEVLTRPEPAKGACGQQAVDEAVDD